MTSYDYIYVSELVSSFSCREGTYLIPRVKARDSLDNQWMRRITNMLRF